MSGCAECMILRQQRDDAWRREGEADVMERMLRVRIEQLEERKKKLSEAVSAADRFIHLRATSHDGDEIHAALLVYKVMRADLEGCDGIAPIITKENA